MLRSGDCLGYAQTPTKLLQVARQRLGFTDIPVLACLVTAGQQDDELAPLRRLGVGRFKRRHRHRALDSDRLAECLDSLDFVHRLRREVRLATTWARPQRNAFYDEEVGALAKAAGHVFQLNLAAAAMRTMMFN